MTPAKKDAFVDRALDLLRKVPGQTLAMLAIVLMFLWYQKEERSEWGKAVQEIQMRSITTFKDFAERAGQAIDRLSTSIDNRDHSLQEQIIEFRRFGIKLDDLLSELKKK